jgi:hypothetical protein
VLDYQLFHESFREYLVKEKALKVQEAGERIIDFCAGWRELEGSWEQRYALEHYAAHLAESKRHERAGELIKLLYDKPYASAQKKVLKNFNATALLYRQSLLKASEQQLWDDQLEAALSLVDLHYEEANDAPQVVAMVANGEIDLALKRIESFGGADKEGVERKFILYMLCLMELTLLESKTKPFRKAAIEKLLNHLDEHIPTDTSIITWNDFFPSYLMFLMACEWAELGLDYFIVYKRTDNWDNAWLKEKGPYTELQLEVLLECARGISYVWQKSSALQSISGELAKQEKIDEALECARGISDESEKSSALRSISGELAKQGKIEEAVSAMQEALECTRGISDESEKSSALRSISGELAKQGNWALAETTGFEISQLSERHSGWKAIAENSCKAIGWQKSLKDVYQLQTDEARLFFLKGWADSVNEKDADQACLHVALCNLALDSESIETFLQRYALHEVFFGNASREKINQLNRTLNIQWVLDIATQFPKEESSTRLSTNLDTWLHEIEDEDDREQIELWAKQVAKGKITEEEFGEKVRGLLN